MKFLVYTVEPLDDIAPLSSFNTEADKEISKVATILRRMNLDRVEDNETVNLLVRNVDHDQKSNSIVAEIYKLTNREKALHQLSENDEGMTMEELISENEDAFIQGLLGVKKSDGEIYVIVEKGFGSFFVSAARSWMDIEPQYSSDTIESIQKSDTIGRTTLDFADNHNLTASLFKPPEDEDVREEEGFGNVDLANRIAALFNISQAHRISLDIDRDKWLDNIDIFDNLIEEGIVTTVRVKKTIDGVVKLGEGGDRAIREDIKTSRDGRKAVKEAFDKLYE